MVRRIDDDMYEVNMLAHPEDGFYKQKNFDKKTSVPAPPPPPPQHTHTHVSSRTTQLGAAASCDVCFLAGPAERPKECSQRSELDPCSFDRRGFSRGSEAAARLAL